MEKKHYKDIIKKIDFVLLITILLSLVTLWTFIHSSILEMTMLERSDFCIGLSVGHYILSLYIIMAIYICYKKGVAVLDVVQTIDPDNSGVKETFVDRLTYFFMSSWIYALLFTLFTIVYFFIANVDNVIIEYLYFAIMIIVFIKTLYRYIDITHKGYKAISVVVSAIILLAGYYVFLFIMITTSASIKFNTTKSYYTSNDTEIVVLAEPHGYIYVPKYTFKYYEAHDNHGCIVIPTKGINSSLSGINVSYYNSFLNWFNITQYTYVKIYYNDTDR